MLILERYLSRELLRPVWGLCFFLLCVVLIFYASRFLGRAATEGLPMELIGVMVGLRLGLFLDVLIPSALLLGLLVGLGRLQSAHETTALVSAGVAPNRWRRLLIVKVVLLAAVVLALSGWFRPWAYQTLYQLDADLAADVTIERIEPGRFQVGGRHWLIHAEGRDAQGLTEVMIHYRNRDVEGGNETRSLLTAQRMQQRVDELGQVRLLLSDQVRSYALDPARAQDMVANFQQLELILPAPPLTERAQLRRARSLGELWVHEGRMELAELQWRLLAPVTVLVFAFAALTIGRRPPRSQSPMPIWIGLLLITAYFSAVGAVINALEQGRLAAWPGAFLVPLVVLLLLVVVHSKKNRRGHA